jgi:hypothetical protein
MSLDSNRNIDDVSKELINDADKHGTVPRFGYFSIPYSSYIGDRFYSQNRKKIYRTSERKVITEPRGIYTNPLKKGQTKDAYFSNLHHLEKNVLSMVEEKAKQERDNYMALVGSRKNKNAVYKQVFKPSGPQEYKDFYEFEENKVQYDIPLTYEEDKKKKIDKEHRNVYTEKRGIYTNVPKSGTSSYPGVLFSYFPEDKKLLQLKKETKVRPKSTSADKKDYKAPFKPASVAKNEPFQSDGELYREDDKEFKGLLKSAIDVSEYNNY